jgi:hypothetical protein
MSGSDSSDPGSNPVRRLVFLAALAVLMYLCQRTFRFTHDGLNIGFGCLYLLLPLFAIKPALRLPRWAKMTTLTLLVPSLTFSVLGLSAIAACDIPDAFRTSNSAESYVPYSAGGTRFILRGRKRQEGP